MKIFTQPDSLLPNLYDPQQLNRYSFERNNPYKNKDEKGHQMFEAFPEFAYEQSQANLERYKFKQAVVEQIESEYYEKQYQRYHLSHPETPVDPYFHALKSGPDGGVYISKERRENVHKLEMLNRMESEKIQSQIDQKISSFTNKNNKEEKDSAQDSLCTFCFEKKVFDEQENFLFTIRYFLTSMTTQEYGSWNAGDMPVIGNENSLNPTRGIKSRVISSSCPSCKQ